MGELADRLLASTREFHGGSLSTLHPYANSEDVHRDRSRGKLKGWLLARAADIGFTRCTPAEGAKRQRLLRKICQLEDGLNNTYDLLEDDHSRRTLVDVMAFRVMGSDRVRLQRNDGNYLGDYLAARSLVAKAKSTPISLLDGWLDTYDLSPLGYPLSAELHHLSVVYTFQAQQYRYCQGGVVVEASDADVVIDGGGCWGDTALYFAHKVGADGLVYTFEFSPDNVPILSANLGRNPELSRRVRVVERALWDASEEVLNFHPAGPATALGGGGESAGEGESLLSAETLTIDDLVAREGIARVGFIKMDIEGAECRALRGAEATLRRDRPKLAITLYHSLSDFVDIPGYLSSLDLGYKFYVDHFSIKQEETVLFATTAG